MVFLLTLAKRDFEKLKKLKTRSSIESVHLAVQFMVFNSDQCVFTIRQAVIGLGISFCSIDE